MRVCGVTLRAVGTQIEGQGMRERGRREGGGGWWVEVVVMVVGRERVNGVRV